MITPEKSRIKRKITIILVVVWTNKNNYKKKNIILIFFSHTSGVVRRPYVYSCVNFNFSLSFMSVEVKSGLNTDQTKNSSTVFLNEFFWFVSFGFSVGKQTFLSCKRSSRGKSRAGKRQTYGRDFCFLPRIAVSLSFWWVPFIFHFGSSTTFTTGHGRYIGQKNIYVVLFCIPWYFPASVKREMGLDFRFNGLMYTYFYFTLDKLTQ